MIKKFIIGTLACVITCSVAASENDPVAELRKNQPKPVTDLIDRIVDCNHWRGEEPYDAGRAKEIKVAMAELRCSKLEQDTSIVFKKFESNPKAKKAIEAAKDVMQ